MGLLMALNFVVHEKHSNESFALAIPCKHGYWCILHA
jgi:hypothetical protein